MTDSSLTRHHQIDDLTGKTDILNTEVIEDYLELSGWTEDQNWGIWRIKAESFTLTFNHQKEIKR